MSCADPNNTAECALRTPITGGWVGPDRDSDFAGNAEICPPPNGWLQGQVKWRACRRVTRKVYTASGKQREGKSPLGMHER